MMGTQRVEKYTKIHTSSHLLLCLFIGGALNQAGSQQCCLSRDFLRKKDTMCLKVVLPDMELQS